MSRIKEYHLVDPEIWNSMQQRLKYTTSPEMKHLLSADESLTATLADPTLTPEVKHRLLGEAVHNLQTYKQSAQETYKPAEPNFQHQNDHQLQIFQKAHFNKDTFPPKHFFPLSLFHQKMKRKMVKMYLHLQNLKPQLLLQDQTMFQQMY